MTRSARPGRARGRREPARAAAALLLLAVALAGARPAEARERILAYDADIAVAADGTLTVRETIRVQAEGDQIKRGIYRDFPTLYRDGQGGARRVPFEVLDTRRDGQPEPRRQERLANGVRTYLGQADVFLAPGPYTYTIVYRTARQLGLFADHDELYWNVTGNDWTFVIEKATATVTLPGPVAPGSLRLEAHTGPAGARGREWTAATDGRGRPVFATTRPLQPRDGLTIVVGFPKGLVSVPPPTARDAALEYLESHWTVVAGGAGLLLVLVYYGWAWWRVGRDPGRGLVVPRWDPPGGLSPAAVRYVWRMGFDDRTFATALISLAVRGVLTLEQEGTSSRLYRAVRRPEPPPGPLTPDEQRLARVLFSRGDTVAFTPSNHVVVGQARSGLRTELVKAHDRVAFRLNRGWLAPGIVLSLLSLAAVVAGDIYFRGDPGPAVLLGFMSIWLSGWTLGTVQAWRRRRWVVAVLLTFFWLVAMGFVLAIVPAATVAVLGLLLAVNLLFHRLLRAPTRAGRSLLDEVEGLRMYLTIAERDRLNALHPPEETPATFERFLPYAFALDVDQAWAERFAAVLARHEGPTGTTGYSPTWYRGTDPLGATPAALGSSLAGLGPAVAAAATAPGSSSGGGGGGSSGGGGGGGGGGGW